jgi:hypothetical protein
MPTGFCRLEDPVAELVAGGVVGAGCGGHAVLGGRWCFPDVVPGRGAIIRLVGAVLAEQNDE